MQRILLMMAGRTWAECERAVAEAREMARQPELLSTGLVLREEPSRRSVQLMLPLRPLRFMLGRENAWQALPSVWQGEALTLLCTPETCFARGWDRKLQTMLKACDRGREGHVVFSGYLPRPEDPVRAVAPVALQGFDNAGRMVFHRGVPLQDAASPERSPFLHRDFCFGPTAFFLEMAGEHEDERILAAFAKNWEIWVPNAAPLSVERDWPLMPLEMPGGARTQARFGGVFGIDFEARTVSPRAYTGISDTTLTPEMRVPLRRKLQEAIRQADAGRWRLDPVFVTACLTWPRREVEEAAEIGALQRLLNLRHARTLCFTDTGRQRQVRRVCPEADTFTRRCALPTRLPLTPERLQNYFALCKFFTLLNAREKQLAASHFIWVDPGILTWPVYGGAALDWQNICGSRIVMGESGGQADTSCIAVPQEMVMPVCREIYSICEARAAERGTFPSEEQVMQQLLIQHPDWFELLPMPRRGDLITLLMLTPKEVW